MAAHNELGKWGEQIAADYLVNKGWKVLHRNWSYEHKDIDIVCYDVSADEIVFVEVKTRSSREWGEPYEAINLQKKNNIINAATAYLHEFALYNRSWRYDGISIVGTPDSTHTIEHTKNIANILDKQAYNQQKRYNKQRPGTWGSCKWRRW